MIHLRGNTWVDLFRGGGFLLKRSVCNLKGLLRGARFGIRAQLDALRFLLRGIRVSFRCSVLVTKTAPILY